MRLTLWISTSRSRPATSTPSVNASADRHQDAEQQERDEDRQQRERRAELAPPEVLPDQREELHADPSPSSRPFSRCSVRLRALGGVRIVRDHHDRLAVIAVERLQQVEDFVAGLAIEIARRLVAEQQRRIGDDRARDADALFLAAGELARVVLRAIGQADDLERDARRACAARPCDSCVRSSGSSTLRSAVSTGSRL